MADIRRPFRAALFRMNGRTLQISLAILLAIDNMSAPWKSAAAQESECHVSGHKKRVRPGIRNLAPCLVSMPFWVWLCGDQHEADYNHFALSANAEGSLNNANRLLQAHAPCNLIPPPVPSMCPEESGICRASIHT